MVVSWSRHLNGGPHEVTAPSQQTAFIRATDRTGVVSCEFTLFQTFIKTIIHYFLNEEIKSTEGTTLILANSTCPENVFNCADDSQINSSGKCWVCKHAKMNKIHGESM